MGNFVQVKDVKIGEGSPKICVPLVAKTEEEFVEAARRITSIKLDVVEIRIDHFNDVENFEKVKELVKKLRDTLKEIPLLFTFRSFKEGGEKEISTEYYKELNIKMAQSGLVDLVDVELFTGDEIVKEIVSAVHEAGVKVVMSNHDFHKTPEKCEIIKRLCTMQELDADLPKIAVMPQSLTDVLTLLQATTEMKENYSKTPVITMSMGGLGVISRICGETFGSALTFGAAGTASAPGQIDVTDLGNILEVLHRAR